jgi:diguanylate cyclase (GGDEF)-like protein
VSFLVHGALALYFFFAVSAQTADELAWRTGILLAHSAQSMIMAMFCLISHSRIYKQLTPRANGILQGLVIIDTLAAGIAIVTIDQLVTSNITPFLLACTITALAFIIRPDLAALFYMFSYAAFLVGLRIHQTDAVVLSSNQVNGLAVTGIGAGLSVLLWMGFSKSIRQERQIIKANRELQDMNEKLAFLASHDAMTGLLNRARFEEHVLEEIHRIRRYGGRAALILFDMDNFKQINDQYGHPTGDEAIRQISRTVRENLRITDSVARWGGEEFSVLLPETTPDEACAVAEKIRACIELQPFTVRTGVSIFLTASVGVTMLDISSEDPMIQAYQEADSSLYRAKALGKNRVVFLQPASLLMHSAMNV